MPLETDEVEEVAAPSYVTKEEYAKTQEVLQSLQQGMQAMTAGFNAMAAQRQATREPEPAAIDDVTDDEIEEALQTGRGAQTFRKMVNAGIERVKRDVIQPSLSEGFGALAGLTKDVVAQQMPYYKRFQGEIDQYIEALPQNAKLQPASYKAAHDYVVGLHVSEIMAEEREAAIRQQNQPPAVGNTPGQTARGQQPRTGQTDYALSEDNRQALAVKGDTQDTFAKKMGYQDWSDYMKKTEGF